MVIVCKLFYMKMNILGFTLLGWYSNAKEVTRANDGIDSALRYTNTSSGSLSPKDGCTERRQDQSNGI